MRRALAFQINELEFSHALDTSRDLAAEAQSLVFDRRGESLEKCLVTNEESVRLDVRWRDKHFGTFLIYRMRQIANDPLVVSALPGPMFDDMGGVVRPEVARNPLGQVINQSAISKWVSEERSYFRRVFHIMEWIDENGLLMDDGTELEIHWRFPDRADGDCIQTEWAGTQGSFDKYAKKITTFRGDGVPQQMLRTRKPVDPDPGRAAPVRERNA